MTKIEMHQRLQPLYKKMMGENICGDYYYCPECGHTRFMDDKNIDRCLYADSSKDKIIWIPLPIDPNNSERGLWGMITSWKTIQDYNMEMLTLETNKGCFSAKDPEEALLMALLEQEGL